MCPLTLPASGLPLSPSHGGGILTQPGPRPEPRVTLMLSAFWPHLSSGFGPDVLGSRLSTFGLSAWKRMFPPTG